MSTVSHWVVLAKKSGRYTKYVFAPMYENQDYVRKVMVGAKFRYEKEDPESEHTIVQVFSGKTNEFLFNLYDQCRFYGGDEGEFIHNQLAPLLEGFITLGLTFGIKKKR